MNVSGLAHVWKCDKGSYCLNYCNHDNLSPWQQNNFEPRWRSRQRVSLIIWRSWVQSSHGAVVLKADDNKTMVHSLNWACSRSALSAISFLLVCLLYTIQREYASNTFSTDKTDYINVLQLLCGNYICSLASHQLALALFRQQTTLKQIRTQALKMYKKIKSMCQDCYINWCIKRWTMNCQCEWIGSHLNMWQGL